MAYVETYYGPAQGADAPRPALSARIEVDVCVVGGGLAGLTAALELARRGRKVCVVEAERIAWGASGRNGGFVSPGYSASNQTIARHVGAQERDVSWAGLKEDHCPPRRKRLGPQADRFAWASPTSI